MYIHSHIVKLSCMNYLIIIGFNVSDYVSRKLYWIDAKQNEIKSVNYDGSGVRTVIRDAEKVLHPFAITVFEVCLTSTIYMHVSL